jgi:hypothetical protein
LVLVGVLAGCCHSLCCDQGLGNHRWGLPGLGKLLQVRRGAVAVDHFDAGIREVVDRRFCFCRGGGERQSPRGDRSGGFLPGSEGERGGAEARRGCLQRGRPELSLELSRTEAAREA